MAYLSEGDVIVYGGHLLLLLLRPLLLRLLLLWLLLLLLRPLLLRLLLLWLLLLLLLLRPLLLRLLLLSLLCITSKHLQFVAYNLSGVSICATLISPFAGLQLSLNINLGTFFQILPGNLAKTIKENHSMPLSLGLSLSGILVFPLLAGCD
jgi:hypothetical protein